MEYLDSILLPGKVRHGKWGTVRFGWGKAACFGQWDPLPRCNLAGGLPVRLSQGEAHEQRQIQSGAVLVWATQEFRGQEFGVCVCVLIGSSDRLLGQIGLQEHANWVGGKRDPFQAGAVLDEPIAMAVRRASGGVATHVYIAGRLANAGGGESFAIVRYGIDGNPGDTITWTWPDGPGGENFTPMALTVQDDGDVEATSPAVFVTGHVPGVNGTRDCRTIALTLNLQERWSERFNHYNPLVPEFYGDDIPVAIAINADRVAVAVTSAGYGTGTDVQLLVYDFRGNLLGNPNQMRRSSAGNANDVAVGVAIHAEGIAYIAGNYDLGGGWWRVMGSQANPDPPLTGTKYLWGTELVSPADQLFEAKAMRMLLGINPTSARMFLTGRHRPTALANDDAFLLQFNFGNISSWAAAFDGHGETDMGLAVDADWTTGAPTYIAVGGYMTENGLKKQLMLLYEDGAQPFLRWVGNPENGGNPNDVVTEVQVRHGTTLNNWRIYSTGWVHNGGAYQWNTRRYNSIEVDPQLGVSTAVTTINFAGPFWTDTKKVLMRYSKVGPYPQDNVMVAGPSILPATNVDFVTIRYEDYSPP